MTLQISELDIQIAAASWRKIPRLRPRLLMAGEAVAAHLPAKFRFPFQATVLLTTDAKIRQLNCDFRGIDRPTNVLSFPQYDSTDLPKSGKKSDRLELGDVALAYTYMAKEARQNNKLIINHTIHLTVHGLLHLFGYDHMMDTDADRMERLETTIMLSLGLPDPYAEPAHSTK